MNRIITWFKTRMYIFDIAKFVLVLILLGMAISLNVQAANTTRQTQQITSNTNALVKSQTNILTAIKGVADDTKLTAEQQTKIIICMLQVPVAQRTTDTENNCRMQISVAPSAPIANPPAAVSPPRSSSPTTAATTPGQQGGQSRTTPHPDNDGIITPHIFFIPSIHIPSPL